jgi:hypothetical protein
LMNSQTSRLPASPFPAGHEGLHTCTSGLLA